jgi:hypothetical protein
MAHEWNIRPCGSACAVCGTEFKKKQECVSAIFEVGEEFERRDFCLDCWGKRSGDAPFSFWQGAYVPPPAGNAKQEPVKRETAEALLRRLITLDDPANTNVVYILAVMLERKKQLLERDAKPREGGGIYRFYEHKASGDTFVVLDPQLRLQEIGEVQRQVIALLEGGGPQPTAGDTPKEAPPAPSSQA